MRTSVPGSSRHARGGAGGTARRSAGFTLVELMVVLIVLGVAASAVVLSLRDASAPRLEREAERLALLLEQARYEARASGLAVRWMPTPQATAPQGAPFDFIGLPPSLRPPQHWLDPQVRAEVIGASAVVLGPEAVIGAQRIALTLQGHTRIVSTQGLAPFALEPAQGGTEKGP